MGSSCAGGYGIVMPHLQTKKITQSRRILFLDFILFFGAPRHKGKTKFFNLPMRYRWWLEFSSVVLVKIIFIDVSCTIHPQNYLYLTLSERMQLISSALEMKCCHHRIMQKFVLKIIRFTGRLL
jgi:hypothetical protein